MPTRQLGKRTGPGGAAPLQTFGVLGGAGREHPHDAGREQLHHVPADPAAGATALTPAFTLLPGAKGVDVRDLNCAVVGELSSSPVVFQTDMLNVRPDECIY